jgi:hypothetical protein
MFLTVDVSTQVGKMALVPQVVDAVKVPVIAAGESPVRVGYWQLLLSVQRRCKLGRRCRPGVSACCSYASAAAREIRDGRVC